MIGGVSAAAASTRTSTRQQQRPRRQGRAPSRGGTIETSNSGSLQQLHNLPAQDGIAATLPSSGGPVLNPEEPGAPIIVDMNAGDLEEDIEAATVGANQRNRVTQPGAYAVSVPAVSAPPSEPARRRMFRRNRDRHRHREIDWMEQIENAVGYDMPLDGEDAEGDDAAGGGGGRRSRGRRTSLMRPDRAPSGGGADGGVVTVVQATAVEDEVFEASIVEDKDVESMDKWTTKQKAFVFGTLLVFGLIMAVPVTLSSKSNASSAADQGTANTEESFGLGEVCINDDPTTCGCYAQADYRGTINTTVSGHTCLAWGVQDPHEHVYVPSERWPSLEANYCRNPDESPGAWCYTTDPDVRWEYCNVPQCETSTVPITASPVAAPVHPSLLDIETYCIEGAIQPQEETSGIYLDGETAHIALTNTSQADSGLNFDGGPLTIEAWIKPELKVHFATILSNKEGGSGKTGFLFSVNTWEQQNGKLYFEGTYGQVASTKSVQWGTWQHVAVTYDGTNPAFYIDGEQIPFYKAGYYGPFNIEAGYLDTKIGEMGLLWSNSFFKGSIDELKVWDYARTGEEIRSSMHCQGDDTAVGLVSYYRFDEVDDGTAVHDSGPMGNHGVIVVKEGNEESQDGENGSESSVGYRYTEGISLCTSCSGNPLDIDPTPVEACINDDPTSCTCNNGLDYRGPINTTISGHTCQAWSAQEPHEHKYLPSKSMPSLRGNNACRNPDGADAAVWCYTTDPDVRWEYCNIPKCDWQLVKKTLSPVAAPVAPPLLDIETYCEEEDVQSQEETSAIYLDGETSHISLPNTNLVDSGLNFDGGPLTIEAWIKPEVKTNFATILSNKVGGNGNIGFLFSVNTWEQQNGRLYFEGSYAKVATTKSVQWGTWQHVAVTYDGTNPAFYIDGEQIPFAQEGFYGPFGLEPGYLDTKIGEMGQLNSNSYFKGSIDELKVWDYAKTGEEILSSMHCQGDDTAAGLISYYRFEESDGTAVHDSGPMGNHGVLFGGRIEKTEDGGDDYVSSAGYMYTEGIPLCTSCFDTGREGQ